jgi:hypothetical protein
MNTNGGYLSHSHAGGPGIFDIIELVLQLRGEAGDRQVPRRPGTALVHADGGVMSAHVTLVLQGNATSSDKPGLTPFSLGTTDSPRGEEASRSADGPATLAAVTVVHRSATGEQGPFGIALADVDDGARVMVRCDPGCRPGERGRIRMEAFAGDDPAVDMIPIFHPEAP